MKHNVFFKRLLPLLLFFGLLSLLSFRWGKLPAMGPLLFPHSGIWNMPEATNLISKEFFVKTLKSQVEVIWDVNRVPHIRANNEEDLAFVQGYVHASQRLFQMEIQSRAGGGRLSELVGPRTLEMDSQYRRMGLHRIAEKSLSLMQKNPELQKIIERYADGVNSFIDTLDSRNMPTEYRFLGAKPSRWTPLQTAEFLAMMTYRLSGRSFDLPLTVLAKKIGVESVRELFPEFLDSGHEAPFIKDPKRTAREWNLDSRLKTEFLSDFSDLPDLLQPFRSNGSNSWGVSAAQSRTHYAMIANDTHLGFSAPGIWFEEQLLTPYQNVYGGGFAGSPGIMSGFTQKAAWAVTNATTDVMDWYQLEFKDDLSAWYRDGDDWIQAQSEHQTILINGESPQKIEILWTKFGPLVLRHGRKGLALRWTAHDGSLALKSFLDLNRMTTHKECREIVSQFDSPNQNFICADSEKLSITQAGRVPQRWRGQGQFILNGNQVSDRWGKIDFTGEFLYEEASDFVSSANQRPVSESSALYLGAESENSWRGRRIQKLLGEKQGHLFTLEDFVRFQLDDFNPLAEEVLPILMRNLEGTDQEQRFIINELLQWNFHDDENSIAAGFFFKWWRAFERAQWKVKLGELKSSVWPRDQLLAQALKDPTSRFSQKWIIDLKKMANETFQETWEFFRQQQKGSQLSLKKVRPLIFPHVARFPGMEISLSSNGGRQSLNAIQTNHGPTWRMVVELGEMPRAFTSVPGTSAGDPLSIDFGRGYEDWAKGIYKSAQFYSESGWDRALKTSRSVWRFQQEKQK